MSNHFHLVAVGDCQDAISHFMMEVNGQYATYRNATQRTTGRVWQNRFYSCVLDDSHWETALRYIELNPVRARLAKAAEDHRWSTVRAHLGLETPPEWLDMDQFLRRWPTPDSWRDSLATLTRREVAAVRRATRHDSALGSDEFLQNLERTYQNPPARPPHRPASQGSSDRNAAEPSGKPIGDRLNAELGSLATNSWPQHLAFPSNCKARSPIPSII